tara:strand:+ start:89 stop:748 length:660 start_codon:yes stop_codon:yes gene_type:complete
MNKVSVIIAAYNQEKYIGRCLRSLLQQNLSNDLYEIIIVNDASDDRTSYALDLFCDPRKSIIKVINNKNNLGLPSSLNKAIKFSNSKYIVRVDSDDWVSKDFLKILYIFLENNSYMDAIACDYIITNDKEEILERKNCNNDPIACGIMFRKKQILEIGLYDENFYWHEEKDLRIRFEKKYKIHRLELPLYRYRKHFSNMTNNQNSVNLYNQKLKEKHSL